MTSDIIEFTVSRDGLTGGLQLAINERHPDGSGGGFRIAGPKFSGTGQDLLRAKVDERTAKEVRYYLDKAFPDERTATQEAAIANFVAVICENAQKVHQGYHTDMKGTWRDCAKDSCMSASIAVRGFKEPGR